MLYSFTEIAPVEPGYTYSLQNFMLAHYIKYLDT